MSSTLRELAEERSAARRAIEGMHLTPVLFELGDGAQAPRTLYRSYVGRSDVFVGIYGSSYGGVEPDMNVSALEDEYVMSDGLPRLVYVKDVPDREPALKRLLRRMGGDGVSYRTFSSAGELEERLRNDLAVVLTERFTADKKGPSTGSRGVGGLPADTAPFIGRRLEVEQVRALLSDDEVRLVTLTGPGGIGKTRLAIEAARGFADEFEDGIYFAGLAPTRDPELVAAAVARALGRAAAGEETAATTVKDALAEKRVLLLLDNFEQVLPAAPFVADLLAACPNLKIMVTSRTVLRLQAEHEYFVHPLRLPADEGLDALESSDAVIFFIERAHALRPSTHFSADDLEAIGEICKRLDGLPLAIELAAARVRLLPPRRLLEHMSKGLEVISGGARDMPERHRTIRATIRWSHDLLDDNEKRLFSSLGAFASSFTLAACEAVCGADDPDVLETLSSLIDKSIVHPDSESRIEPRFVMLQTIHEFAVEQLHVSPDVDELRDRHARFYMGLVDEAGAGLKSRDQARWLLVLEAEIDNLRCAVGRCLEKGDYERIGEFAYSLWLFLWLSGRLQEARGWSELAVEHLDTMGERGAARAVMGKAAIAFWQADYINALPVMYQALEALEKVGEEEGAALALLGLGMSAPFLGDIEEGRSRLTRSREIFERLGNEWGTVVSSNGMGWLLLMGDRYKDELPLYEEAFERAKGFGTEVDLGMAMANLGRYWIYQGDPRGVPYMTEALVLYSTLGNRAPTANVVEGLAEAAFTEGDHGRAARLFGMAMAFRDSVGALPLAGARERIEGLVARLREAMGESAYERAVEEVSSLPFKRAIEEALQVPIAR